MAFEGQLRLATVNSKVREAQYAVRGVVLDRALELQAQLESGTSSLPFDHIVKCNIGNPQALGQKPLTFVRQVLALCLNPDLLKTKKGSGWAPADVILRAKKYLEEMRSVGAYTNSQGLRCVREEVAEAIARRDGFPSDASDIFLTDGASAGVKVFMNLLFRRGDDAILAPIPQYPLYSATITLLGGTLVPYILDESASWGINVAALRKALRRSRRAGAEVRAIVVINPGNPTGQIMEESIMRNVLQLCVDERLVLIADEVYQRNVYKAATEFVSFKKVLRLMEESGEIAPGTVQLVSLHSISKGFTGECGLRGGYFEAIGFDAGVKAQIVKLASIGLCSSVPGQLAVGLTSNPPVQGDPSFAKYNKESAAIIQSLKARSSKLVAALRTLEGVTCNDADGAMYVFPNITMPPAALEAAMKRKCSPDTLYALELVEHTGIVVVGGSGFRQKEGTHHIRITILTPEDQFDEVIDRLTDFHERFMAGTTHSSHDNAMNASADSNQSLGVCSPGSKLKKMLTRTIIAFTLFALFFTIMKAGHRWMILAVLLIQVELFREFTNVRYNRGLEVKIPLFRSFLYSMFFSTLFVMQGAEGFALLVEALDDVAKYVRLKNLSTLIVTAGDAVIGHFEWCAFAFFAAALVMFVTSLRMDTLRYQFKQLAWTCLALVIVCAQSNSFTFNILNGFFWFYVPATLVVCNDTLAYFGGACCGKRIFRHFWGPKKGQRLQFFPLSPNKTWEGFICGLIFTLLWGFYFSRFVVTTPSLFNLWTPDYIICGHSDIQAFEAASEPTQQDMRLSFDGHRCQYPEYMLDRDYAIPGVASGALQRLAAQINALCGPSLGFSADGLSMKTLPIQWHFIFIGLFVSLIAPFGGFFASGLKRAYGIKDFDSILPGHGGLMDRLDCHLITGFMTRIHFIAFVAPFQTTIVKLLFNVAKLPVVQQHNFFRSLVAQLSGDGTDSSTLASKSCFDLFQE
jgi:alanine transaminase